jgi:hypothetical protein
MRRRTGVATAMRIAINRFYFDLVRCEWNEPVELKCLLFGSSRPKAGIRVLRLEHDRIIGHVASREIRRTGEK